MRTGDPQGTVLMDGDLMRGLVPDLVEPGFLFTTELVYLAERAGIVPVEVPVRLSDDHDSHETRISRADVLAMGGGAVPAAGPSPGRRSPRMVGGAGREVDTLRTEKRIVPSPWRGPAHLSRGTVGAL